MPGSAYQFLKIIRFLMIICSDAVLEVEDHVSPEELAVEKVDHCSIELSWNTEEEDRSGPPDEWTRFAVEQMDPKTNTFFTVYM